MTAVVPPGLMPGQPMPEGPNGMPFHVAVPPGAMPGQSFQFQAPSQAPMATAMPMQPTDVPMQATAVPMPMQSHGEPVVVYGQVVAAQPVEGLKY